MEGDQDVEGARRPWIIRTASEEHDAAYRVWRAGDGKSNLASYLAAPPILTKFALADDI